jgi:hypothetical protein
MRNFSAERWICPFSSKFNGFLANGIFKRINLKYSFSFVVDGVEVSFIHLDYRELGTNTSCSNCENESPLNLHKVVEFMFGSHRKGHFNCPNSK